MTAPAGSAQIIRTLELQPHPEGGWYRETFRDAASTAIFYLLERGQVSAWRRVKGCAETWRFYAGDPCRLSLAPPDGTRQDHTLGPDVLAGQTPQAVVPPGWWQAAEPLGAWTLVGCTVAPAFDFAAFELAPQGWTAPS